VGGADQGGEDTAAVVTTPAGHPLSTMLIKRIIGLALVCGGIYLAFQLQSGVALFVGFALLSIGLLLFLGPWASFGSGGNARNAGDTGIGALGGDDSSGDGSD
jgi:hypothetical protein